MTLKSLCMFGHSNGWIPTHIVSQTKTKGTKKSQDLWVRALKKQKLFGFTQTTQSFSSYHHVGRFQYYAQNGFCSKQTKVVQVFWTKHMCIDLQRQTLLVTCGQQNRFRKNWCSIFWLMWRQARTASWKSFDSTGTLVETPLSFSARQAITTIKLYLQLQSFICSPLLHIQAKSLSWFIRHVSIITFNLHPLQMAVKNWYGGNTSLTKVHHVVFA